MIVKPKIRGFICTTAHPVGCAQRVKQEIELVKKQPAIKNAPKRVLVIGASTGYGLSSRVMSTYGGGASTIGVYFERDADKKKNRTATAGWYNSVGFKAQAEADGYYAHNINGDAFSDEIKKEAIAAIKKDLQQVDLVVYSLASPRRTDPVSGKTYHSAIKPIGIPYTTKTMNTSTGVISMTTVDAASENDITETVKVMGGEDWERWIEFLSDAEVLADGATTMAYSYIGPEVTTPTYRRGTIGRAKVHLEDTARRLNERLSATGGKALISVNKALVTQSSSAIPVIPLYISLLYKVMKHKNIHEGCIEQVVRLYNGLFDGAELVIDDKNRVRVDDLEMREDVQELATAMWHQVNDATVPFLCDLEGYREEFLNLFGFNVEGVDYEADVEI